MKKILPLMIGLLLAPTAFAENLIQVYEQAKQTNPELKSSFADKEKAYSAITGSRASLLPQLGLTASYGIGHGYREADGSNSKSGNLSLALSQTLFDFSKWKTLDITQKQASVYDISYQAQEQTLILNVSTYYFDVLKAIDTLNYTQAQKKAIFRQLEQTKQKHKVGLVAITDVQNAQANYDLTVAQEVSAVNNVENALENLRQVSGRFYANLATIDTSSFKTAKPDNINTLLNSAEKSNLSLLTARLSQDVAKDQIRLAQSGHLPTLTLNASSALSKAEGYGSNVSPTAAGNRITGQNYVGISLNVPIFTGGATMSQVEQAQYNYVSFSEQLESTNRKVVNGVRSSYNNISASISSIKAYEQAVISAQSSLNATESGYSVGTRTIVDVLSATTQLYSAKKNLSDAKYNYLISLLQLKSATGALTADDLIELNSMLGKQTSTLVSVGE